MPDCRKCPTTLIVGSNCSQSRIDNHDYICNDCSTKVHKDKVSKNPDKYKGHKKKWMDKNPDKIKSYKKNWRDKNKKTIKEKAAIYGNLPQTIEQRKQYRADIKIKVFTHYCGGDVKCNKCPYTDIRALSIDHINGDGSEHRKLINKRGIGFYNWLIKNNYPEGFQVLCMNCQFIKRDENNESN